MGDELSKAIQAERKMTAQIVETFEAEIARLKSENSKLRAFVKKMTRQRRHSSALGEMVYSSVALEAQQLLDEIDK